jgi:hypothetical protein
MNGSERDSKNMKTFTKNFALLLFAMVAIAATSFANPSKKPTTKPVVEVYFLNGDAVTAGHLLKAELSANAKTEVDVAIENSLGDVFGEKHIVIEKGSRLLKFKIEDVPAGEYMIKVYHGREVKVYPFVVN